MVADLVFFKGFHDLFIEVCLARFYLAEEFVHSFLLVNYFGVFGILEFWNFFRILWRFMGFYSLEIGF